MKHSRKLIPFAALALITGLPLPVGAASRSEPGADGWCGTHDSLLEQTLAKHELHQSLLGERPGAGSGKDLGGSAFDVRKEGNVAAIIDNAGRIIRERNLVDLAADFGMRFQYKKRQGGYLVKEGGAFSDLLGEKLDLTDDDSIEIDLPFTVKIYGERFSSLFVNSDGNVTFGEKDDASTFRDLTRVLEGPPRIVPFFTDLNPELAPLNGGVFASVGKKSIRLSWIDVPEFDANGGSARRNTFQMNLAKNGKVTFVFGELGTQEAIIGIAPGGGSPVNIQDYSEQLPIGVRQGAIVESFSNTVTADEAQVAQAFLEAFRDQYEHLVVFTDFPIILVGSPLTIAFELTVNNDIRGIGEAVFDFSDLFGSDGALESYVMMGDVGKYGTQIEDRSLINSVYSPVDVLMHEIGHRWGVKTLFEKDGENVDLLLGRGKVHWSYCTDSENSYLEGNRWVSNGDGTYASVEGEADFNTRDLYNMGLLDADQVTDSFVVTPCNGDRAPEFSGGIAGEQVDYTIDDVIRALGERDPAVRDAPKTFDIGFVLLVKAGEEPAQQSVDTVNAFRKLVAERFKEFGATVKTALRDR